MSTLSPEWLSRRWHLAVLAGWTAVWFAILAPGGGIAWKFFVQGTDLLFTGHDGGSTRLAGLHLYATYPQLQIGPAAYAVAQVLRQAGPDYGMVTAQVVMSAMGLLIVLLVQQIVVAVRPELAGPAGPVRRLRLTMLAGGALFMIPWEELAVAYGHLDDALALTCTALAVWIWVAGRWTGPVRGVLSGLAVGLAATAKPWALAFLPVLFLPDPRPSQAGRLDIWPRVLAAAAAGAVLAAGWLPFFATDPATTNAMHYKIANMPNSALRALGVNAAWTPSWDRSAQVLLGCVLGAIAIRRRRWPAVILLGAGARIALDPGVHGYYTAEVMLGALLWDLLGSRRPFPLWSAISYLALDIAPLASHDNALLGQIRLALVIAFTAAILLAPANWYRHPEPPEPAAQAMNPGRLRLTRIRPAADP
ncbi:MAG TPA: hypothetical protein VGI31_01495 [Streptosporangiaceae bacterium]